MALIREFIEDYRGRIGHFQHLAETCAYQCERALSRASGFSLPLEPKGWIVSP